jgi:hypothetical protein
MHIIGAVKFLARTWAIMWATGMLIALQGFEREQQLMDEGSIT